MRVVATAASLGFLLVLFGATAWADRSLTDFESGNPDESYSLSESGSIDVAALKEEIFLAKTQIKNLTEVIASAKVETEVFKRQYADVMLRLETLGLSKKENDLSGLETRLLQAIRELRVINKKHQAAIIQLVKLSEAITVLVKTSGQIKSEARAAVEAELRETSQILGVSNSHALKANIEDARVVDFNNELSLIVVNVGRSNGVIVGMPFMIQREGQLIGHAKIIDVREHISGAVIQNLSSDSIRVKKGDYLKVNAKK